MRLCLHLFYLTVLVRIALGSRKGQHGNVLPVTPVLPMWDRQFHIHLLASRHIRPRIAQVAHGLLGLNPRAAAHGPTRTSLQAEAQSQTVRLFCRMPHE